MKQRVNFRYGILRVLGEEQDTVGGHRWDLLCVVRIDRDLLRKEGKILVNQGC